MYTDISVAPILACLKGIHALAPVDPTSEFTRYIPYLRTINKLNVPSTDYSDKKNVTVPYFTSKSLITDHIVIADNFAPQYASKMSDKMCYCDYPAINQFKSIDLKVGNAQIETITPQICIKRLREMFEDNWEFVVNTCLGGSQETNHKNQVYEGYSLKGAFNKSDLKKNVIKPGYRWYFPIPASLFSGRDKFKYYLSINSMCEFSLNFASIKTWISYSPDFIPQDLSGTLDVYVLGANPNEYKTYFNNLPHITDNSNENYYVNDIYDEFNEKKQPLNQDLKILLRQGPTKEIRVYYTNSEFCSGYRFFGITVREAAENFIASHIMHTDTNTSANTVNLATGLFPNGTAINGLWTVHNWGGNSFVLKYRKNNSTVYGITITCTTPWAAIGNLYLDLDTYANDARVSRPQLLYFESINLDVRPYDRENISFNNMEDTEITSQGSVLLVNGLYTYKPGNDGFNTMAFWGVNNISQSLQVDDILYDFALSQPVTNSPNTAHLCVTKKQLFLNKPFFNYNDLDMKSKIRTDALYFEKITGGQEMFTPDILLLSRDLRKKRYRTDPDENINFSWTDYKNNIDTDGYMDIQTEQYQYVTVKWMPEPLIFDGQEISDTMKERITQNKQASVTIVQEMIRTLRYNSERRELELVSDIERNILNKEIWNKVLVIDELAAYVQQPESNITSMKRIKTANNNIIEDNVLMRGSRDITYRDNKSLNNTMLKKPSSFIPSIF